MTLYGFLVLTQILRWKVNDFKRFDHLSVTKSRNSNQKKRQKTQKSFQQWSHKRPFASYMNSSFKAIKVETTQLIHNLNSKVALPIILGLKLDLTVRLTQLSHIWSRKVSYVIWFHVYQTIFVIYLYVYKKIHCVPGELRLF